MRYWSDIDFLIIAKDGFKPPKDWKTKFATEHGLWSCYYIPKGIPVDINEETVDVPVGIAVVFEDILKDKAKLNQCESDGLPLTKSFLKKRYVKIT